MTEHVDVLIVGAGLSGIGAASHLQRQRPEKSFVILESRSSIGGTWDLFRYPGVRSDSDMYTLGYSFRPWTDASAIADGDAIREYIRDTVADEGLGSRIHLNTRVTSAEWSSVTARWTVTTVRTSAGEYAGQGDGEVATYTCSFLSVCSGYYRYDEGFTPAIPGSENFAGEIVHPQHWPNDLDYAGKRVVIIGSGATAVTLVPSLAKTAAHVTMLQRSPTYIAPVPSKDPLAARLRRRLPDKPAYSIMRAKNIAYSMFTYQLSRRRPETMKAILRKAAVERLPKDYPVDIHLAPSYNPWDQRLCAIPDADLFRAISGGSADIVTDRIERITPAGIDLATGEKLAADIIVMATGLNLLVLGGMSLTVDGRSIPISDTLAYKGMMLSGVPNFSLTIGYTNASWTLKADLVARYVCRILKYMNSHGMQIVTPEAPPSIESGKLISLIDLDAGYILRSAGALPRQGEKSPWRLRQNYLRDFRLLRLGSITDDVTFSNPVGRSITPPAALEPPGTAMTTVGGARLRYRRTGDGEPVLLLHGIGQSLEDWNEQHDRLSHTHTVVSLDLPGFGYSDRLPGAATLGKLAGILPALLDELGLTEPVAVIGNSLGGAVAMTLAVRHPERVSSLVLANSAGFGKEVTMVLRLLAVKPIGAALMKPSVKSSKRTVSSLFYDRSLATDARIQHSFALSQRADHAKTLLDIATDLGTFRGVSPQWRASLLDAMQAVDVPTLVVWGDHDHVLPSNHLSAALTALPHAESHLFEKTGHMPQIERPDEFAALVESFLARATRAATSATN